MDQLTVFFDGACPLCRREIAFMRRLDRGGRITFLDVAAEGAVTSCPLTREELLQRFHAQLPSGELVSGARAFTEAYARIPGFAFVAHLGRWPWSANLLNKFYGLFLRIRPSLQRMVSRSD